ncbi:MAG: hypothetical protein GX938_04205 [Spirochaetales bacterium]|nr:hypothetical protein [Spirochaetales bacterium]
MLKRIGTWIVVTLLIIPISGCSMGWEAHHKTRIADNQLLPRSAAMIEEQRENVWPFLDEEFASIVARGDLDGQQIVANVLGEEQGREYLEFMYTVGEDEFEEAVAYAYSLLDEESRQDLDEKLVQARALMMQKGEELARALAPSQRAAFWKDMQLLITRTLVLFTAGVVYACIPTIVLWGKIAAATAIAVATGVVASTVMSIWRYYQFGGSADESFAEWIAAVTTEPELSYALAASMIATGETLKRGPVVTGIILCVFAIYNVIDMLKPMLKKYNFTI